MLKRDIDQFDPELLEVGDESELDDSGSYAEIQDEAFATASLTSQYIRHASFSELDYCEEELLPFGNAEGEEADEDFDLEEDDDDKKGSEILEGLEAAELKESGFDGDSYKALVNSIEGRVLTKDEEQRLGRTIQASEHNKQLLIFSNDYAARLCLEPLLRVKDGYREDRILEVSVTNKEERARAVAKVLTNLPTIQALLGKNRELVKIVMNRNLPNEERRESLQELHKNRRKVAILFRETNLRKKWIDKTVEKLKEIDKELNLTDRANTPTKYGGDNYPLTALRLGESAETLGKRLKRIDEFSTLGTNAKRELAAHNVRYVISIAKKFMNKGLSFVDLIQEGNLGLMRATEKFNPHLGWKFSTYCTAWIKQAIRHAIAQKSRTVRITASGIAQLSKFRAMKRELFEELMREPNEEETFNRFKEVFKGTKKEKKATELFTWLNAHSNPMSSLDVPFGSSDSHSFGGFLSKDNRRESSVERDETIDKSERFQQALSVLDSIAETDYRGAEIIRLRFGLGCDRAYTLEEVAHLFNVSRERIRQIESKFITKMKKKAATLKMIPQEAS